MTCPDSPPATPWLTPYRVAVLLSLAALFGYYNSLRGAFIFDDVGNIVTDPNLGKPLAGVLAPRPVASLSFTANYLLDGLNVRGYHLVNLTIHGLAALALHGLVRRSLLLPRFADRFAGRAEWVAFAVALLWFLHPIQTQAVTYIIQRCESLMGMFFLATLYCFVRGATAEKCVGWWYAAAVACCALGAGCKEMMVAVPPLALLYDRTFLAGSWRAALRARWKFYLALSIPPALGAAYILFGGLLADKKGTVGFGVQNFTPYSYFLTQSEVLLYYVRLMAWPDPLCLDYIDWPPPTSAADCWPALVGVAALLAVSLAGVALRKWWAVPAAAFFLVLAPTSSFVPLQDPAFEHRLYLPLAGFVAIAVGVVVAGLDAVVRRVPCRCERLNRAALIGFGLLAVVLGFLTVLRNEDYNSAYRIWADVVAKRPMNYRARGAMASELLSMGRLDEAEKETLRALADYNSSPTNIRLIAFIMLEKGRTAEAAGVFANLLKEMPEDAQLRLWYGVCLVLQNKPAEAVEQLKAAATLTPHDKSVRVAYASALRRMGKDADADKQLDAVLRADPTYPKSLETNARRLAFVPDASPAKLNYAFMLADAAVRMTMRESADPLDSLAVVQARLGKYTDAAASATAAAAVAGKDGDVYKAGRIAKRAELYRANKPYLAESLTE